MNIFDILKYENIDFSNQADVDTLPEELFEKLLRKIESQLKFEEEIKIRRAERNRSLGSSKFELSYQQPYKLRHMKCDK